MKAGEGGLGKARRAGMALLGAAARGDARRALGGALLGAAHCSLAVRSVAKRLPRAAPPLGVPCITPRSLPCAAMPHPPSLA